MKKEKVLSEKNPHALMTHLGTKKTKVLFDTSWDDAWIRDLTRQLHFKNISRYSSLLEQEIYYRLSEYPINYAVEQGTFDLLHAHFPGCNGKSLLEMLTKDSLSGAASNYLDFYNFIRGEVFFRETLKPIYMKMVLNSPEIKSILKIDWALSIENHLIKFLRTSKSHTTEGDTASYKALATILTAHALTETDLNRIKGHLLANIDDVNFEPNPTLAALYFTYRAPKDVVDNNILKKHLMIDKKYSPNAAESLARLLKICLSNADLKNLKRHISNAVKLDDDLTNHGKETLKAKTKSPFTTIICTQILWRGDDKGQTYIGLLHHGLFSFPIEEKKKPEIANAYAGLQVESTIYKPN